MSDSMTQEDAERMDNLQAIQILEPLQKMMIDQYGCPISSAYFALGKAIEALAEPERKMGKWVSVKEYCEHLYEVTGDRYLPTGLGHLIYCNYCMDASTYPIS